MINSGLFDDPSNELEKYLRADLIDAALSLKKVKDFLMDNINLMSHTNKDFVTKKIVKVLYKVGGTFLFTFY